VDIDIDHAAVQAFWEAHGEAFGGGPVPPQFWFMDTPEGADKLAGLVVHGPKRATASLARDYSDAEPIPAVGGLWVVVDGAGRPAALIRTTDVRRGPLSSVSDQFAWDEGEGDRSREHWLRAHCAYFERQAAAEGFEFHPGIETVFERFEVLWPTTDDSRASEE